MHIDERGLTWVYQLNACLALAVALLLPSARRTVPEALRRKYSALQLITLLGAIVGAKLAMLAGDLGWPVRHVALEHAIFSGKSIVGGLLGGFLAAELAKPLLSWNEPPNDWFACKLVLSIAIGRLGCICAGCCRGLPTNSGFAISYSDGVPRVPVTPLELAFHVSLLALFLTLYRAGKLRGRLFALYLVVYGMFRCATEPLRETPKLVGSLSLYQCFALLLIAAGAWSWSRRFDALPEKSLA
jgi:prolipoprotein diacylglyceryltransferase